MSDARRIGLLGGTFDPVHYGHLDAADAARERLHLDEVLFIPSHVPPHRDVQPFASAYDRFALVALAIQDRRDFRLSAMELEREGHSYTFDTLRRLHARGYAALQLFFILGADAFAEIATWHEYPAVLEAAHFVVIARPGASLADACARNAPLASRLRSGNGIGQQTAIFTVDAPTRDVSSTTIRSRLSAGMTIADLVPAPVAHYIAANDLYRTVNQLHG